jgi:hypothetical protein
MAFNLQALMGIFQLAPYVVEGVAQIHSSASTETKTQIASDALKLAACVASTVLPGEAAIVGFASQGIEAIIAALTHAKAAGATIVPTAPVTAAPTPITPVTA